jgi:hypothetical protein
VPELFFFSLEILLGVGTGVDFARYTLYDVHTGVF